MSRKWMWLCGLVVMLVMAGLSASPAAAQAVSGLNGRPVLPNEQTFGTEHFVIHYTLVGHQGVDPADANGNGISDYVETVADTMEHVWQVEVEMMGWAPPPPDRGEGGDTRLDVYLDNILSEGYAGYVESSGGHIGDNPLTVEGERNATYGFMVLDNDYVEVLDDPNPTETPLQLMQASAAHEFNHLIQGGYDDMDPHLWLYEATASWMEDEVYDDVNDTLYYIDAVFDNPDICLVAETARGNDEHWYGEWLLLRLMSERYGSDIVPSIWAYSRDLDGFASINAALAPLGSSLVDESRDFAIANLLRAYEEGSTYPAVHLEGEAGLGVFSPSDGVQGLGADYVRVSGGGNVTITLSDSSGHLFMQVVGVQVNNPQADVIAANSGSLTVNLDTYRAVFVVIHNDEPTSNEARCQFTNYSLTVTPASGAPSEVETTWPAHHFELPGSSVGGHSDSNSSSYQPPGDAPYASGVFADTPAGLDVPFQTLIPTTLPPGYTFDYAYVMTPEDFGQSAPYYVPGGEVSANFDYLDENGNWLSISETPSPYATIREWLEDIDYDTPGEIQSIDGVEVLLEDLSMGSDIWYSDTLILNGLFIVVDGDHSAEDTLALVRSLIGASRSSPQVVTPPAVLQPNPVVAPPTEAPLIGGLATTQQLINYTALGLCAVCLCLVIPVAVVGLVLQLRGRSSKQPPV
jgi:hypothetical protein